MSIDFEQEQADGAAIWADGERTVAAHEDSGSFITSWAERWKQGFKNIDEAMEAIAEIEEHLQPTKIGSEESVQFFKNAVRIIRGDAMNVRAVYDRLHYFMLAMRWVSELGGIDSAAELGRQLKVSKSNATKYETVFRDVLPPGMASMPMQPGQRSDGNRAKFSQIRIDKMKSSTTNKNEH